MQWEVCGADRTTGRDQTLVLDAEDEASAVRRGTRRGLVVAWARPLDPDDGVAGAPAVAGATVPATVHASSEEAEPAYGAGDTVGYAYVAPTQRRRRRKSGGGGGAIVAVIAVAVLGGAGWWAWQATRPAESGSPDGSTASPTASVTGAPATGSPVVRVIPVPAKLPSLHVGADEVLRAHAADPKLAEATYKGRVIEVDGRVETVGAGLFGTPRIALGGSDGASVGDGRVQCTFAKEDVATVNAVHAGDTITVIGTYDGVTGDDVNVIGCAVSANPATVAATQP